MNIRTWIIVGNLALFPALTRPGLAAELVRYAAQPTLSSVRVDGTSTLHPWTVESKMVAGTIELDPKVQFDPAKASIEGLEGNKVPIKASVLIPVNSLRSNHGNAMDNVCHEAMDADKYRFIEYRLSDLSVKNSDHKAGTPFDLEATGNLVIHGTTNKVTMPVTIQQLEAGKLKISGATGVKMTSFGVKPPAPAIAGGLIKTGDDVKITFDWVVAKRGGAAK